VVSKGKLLVGTVLAQTYVPPMYKSVVVNPQNGVCGITTMLSYLPGYVGTTILTEKVVGFE
jgi:hypothetical protein